MADQSQHELGQELARKLEQIAGQIHASRLFEVGTIAEAFLAAGVSATLASSGTAMTAELLRNIAYAVEHGEFNNRSH